MLLLNFSMLRLMMLQRALLLAYKVQTKQWLHHQKPHRQHRYYRQDRSK
jgi:hypothetical protein